MNLAAVQKRRPRLAGRAQRKAVFSRTYGNAWVEGPNLHPVVQAKLKIGAPNDEFEREADRVADAVMRSEVKPEVNHLPAQAAGRRKCASCVGGQGLCEECAEEERLHRKESSGETSKAPPGLEAQMHAVGDGGRPLSKSECAFFEPRFGEDFRSVRLHSGSESLALAENLHARAFTVGRDIFFGPGGDGVGTITDRWLLAHELAHVVQQRSSRARDSVQRADLSSPRLAGNQLFENVLDNTAVIEFGDKGPEVRRIQQLLIDLGFSLPTFGADGKFGSETRNAVIAFQTANPPLGQDGRVGFETMAALDAAFPAFTLPATRSDPWTMSCVLDILCPWNEHLVENVLPSFNIVTFDSRQFPVERWDGSSWQSETFNSGGFRGGTNMGFLNAATCEEFALTVYHEGWHGQQASSLTGVIETERDAYVNTEQWSISVGIPGQTFESDVTGTTGDLRTTSGSGETVVDEAAAEALVRQEYGGVSSVPGERILARTGGTTDPQVRVRRPDGTEYLRNAATGESFRAGPPVMTNLNPIDPANWVCP